MSVNFSEDDLKIPLLITKLNVIKKNNEISIDRRKQKIAEREKNIIWYHIYIESKKIMQ